MLATNPQRTLISAKSRGQSGFSLVEVTLAIGIVAVVFIPLVGLLPVALTSYRGAMDTTLRANMARQVSSQLAQAPFDQIQDRNFYFDDQGILLPSQTSSARFRMICTTSPVETTLFGNDSNPNPAMIKVKMQMTSLLGSASQPALSTATAIIADNGNRTPTVIP